MGALQLGFPNLTMIPQSWFLIVIDLKDCFFTVPLHPNDRSQFAFSVPVINNAQPMKCYQWKVLPQGMKNSRTICQCYVHSVLGPIRQQNPHLVIYHYMDDILLAAQEQEALQKGYQQLQNRLVQSGLQIAPEKIQQVEPWKYLGHILTYCSLRPQRLCLNIEVTTLNDLQKLLGTIN